MALTLKSPSFDNDSMIPVDLTGEGKDKSPELRWSNVPSNCRSVAVICEDPDAPGEEPFVHWVIYNISPSVSSLPTGLPLDLKIDVPVRAEQGMNSYENIGYNGPYPPKGHGIHHYIFKLYALSAEIVPDPEGPAPTKDELLKAMEGKIIDAAQLIGKYERQKSSQTSPKSA